MDNIYISATELKKRVSEVLNSVYFDEKIAVIERYGKPVAKITAFKKPLSKKKNIKKLLDKYFGIMPDFPDVTKDRRSRKHWPTL